MPELPEAETIARGLRDAIVDERIVGARVLHADILREPSRRFTPKLRDRTITGVERRAKNVLIRLSGDHLLAVNLGMTGRLLPFSRPPRGRARPDHPAVRLRFASGGVLVFDDTRRFGTVECLTTEEWQVRSERLGPEPLGDDYRPDDLVGGLARSRAPIRSWLLDQRRIAGIGNIYAAEALFLACIHPRRRADHVRPHEAAALHGALRAVLGEAIRAGGTTIRDYRNADGEKGSFARRLRVYGRDGDACGRCDSIIERAVFANRSAFFCPRCQPVDP